MTTNLIAQSPAQGILLINQWGSSKMYQVLCECGDSDCTHTVEVNADDCGVSVTIFTNQTTDFWTNSIKPRYDIDNEWLQKFDWWWKDLWNGLCTSLRLTKDIWFHGHAKYQASVHMSEQQALNYAETLKNAITDVKNFKQS